MLLGGDCFRFRCVLLVVVGGRGGSLNMRILKSSSRSSSEFVSCLFRFHQKVTTTGQKHKECHKQERVLRVLFFLVGCLIPLPLLCFFCFLPWKENVLSITLVAGRHGMCRGSIVFVTERSQCTFRGMFTPRFILTSRQTVTKRIPTCTHRVKNSYYPRQTRIQLTGSLNTRLVGAPACYAGCGTVHHTGKLRNPGLALPYVGCPG